MSLFKRSLLWAATGLNLVALLASVIWLAVLGQWLTIAEGVVALVGSSLGATYALYPSFALILPAVNFLENGNRSLFRLFVFLSSFYLAILILVWCSSVVLFFLILETPQSIIPSAILSYAVATGAWTWLAHKEQQNGETDAPRISIFIVQIGYILLTVLIIVFGASFSRALAGFSAIMIVSLIFLYRAQLKLDKDVDKLFKRLTKLS